MPNNHAPRKSSPELHDGETPRPAMPGPAVITVHLFTLFAIAVAHPMLDLLVREDHATLLVAHQSQPIDLYALVALLCLALPLGVSLILFTARGVSIHLYRSLSLLVVWVLGLVFFGLAFKWTLGEPEWLATPAALGASLILVYAYARGLAARWFITLMSPAIVLVPALFLMNPVIHPLLVDDDDSGPRSGGEYSHLPSILMLIFDELPLASLLDEHAMVDAGRYPNFARLAETSTWYPNANTIHYSTRFSIPSILTGTDHWERFGKFNVNRPKVMLARETFPENVFSLLEGSHDSYALMSTERIIPPNPEEIQFLPPFAERFGYLISDLAVLCGHMSLPSSLTASLPSIAGQWQDFSGRQQMPTKSEEWPYQGGKPYRIKQLLDVLHRSNRPNLYVAHVVLPHHPFRYNELGQLHEDVIEIPDDRVKIPRGRNLWESEVRANEAWQAHLLQLGFVDRLLGAVLDRLEDLQLLDDMLIVLTADHGISFYWDDEQLPTGELMEIQASEVLNVPLYIKAPGQTRSEVVADFVQTIDILPTIAEMLEVEIPWETDGISVVSSRDGTRDRYSWLMSRRHSLKGATFPDSRSIRQKFMLFGSGSYESLYNYGPSPDLVGLPASQLDTASPGAFISIKDLNKFEDVDPHGVEIPAYVEAEWPAVGGPDTDSVLALAVNGVIRATGQAEMSGDMSRILFRVPPESLRKGENDLRILEVLQEPLASDRKR